MTPAGPVEGLIAVLGFDGWWETVKNAVGVGLEYWVLAPTILATLIALFLLWTNPGEKKRWHLWTLAVLYALAAVFTCGVIVHGKRAAALAKAEAAAAQAEARSQMDRIEGRLGDDDAAKRFLDAQRPLIDRLVRDQTDKAVETFFSSLEERQRLREEIDKRNKQVLTECEVRFLPVYEFIKKSFDSWIQAATQRGISAELLSIEREPLTCGPRQLQMDARTASFANGDTVTLLVSQGVVDDAKLAEPVDIRISFRPANGPPKTIVAVVLWEREYRVSNGWKEKMSFESYRGTAEMPTSDPQFVETLTAALNQAMAFVCERATIAAPPSSTSAPLDPHLRATCRRSASPAARVTTLCDSA